MMTLWILASLLALSPAPGDADEVAAYLNVAQREEAAGHDEVARAAYRSALERAPGNAMARAALERLGRPGAGDGYPDALRLFEARRYAEARAALEALPPSARGDSMSLLMGICAYELGENAQARTALTEAATRPSLADPAHLLLALLALRQDDARTAAYELERAQTSTDPRIRDAAQDLRGAALRQGRWLASLVAETGYDSNVSLLPDGTPTSQSGADEAARIAGAVFFRPTGRSGFRAEASAGYSKQLRIHAFDLGQGSVGLGWQQVGPSHAWFVGYHSEGLLLGGEPYLLSHRVQGEGSWRVGWLDVAASASVHSESLFPLLDQGYSGTRETALVSAGLWRGALRPALALVGELDQTRDRALGYAEYGPRVSLTMVAAALRVLVQAGLVLRPYNVADPELAGTLRSDRYLDASVVANWELTRAWSLRLVGTGRRAVSNVTAFTYTRLAASLELAYLWGWP